MKDYPSLGKISKSISAVEPSRSASIPNDVKKFIDRAKTIAKYLSFDAHRDYDLGPTMLFPEVSYMRQLSVALAKQTEQDAANRRVDDTLKDLRLLRNLPHQLIHEHVLLGGLVNINLNMTFYRSASRAVSWLDSDHDALTKIRTLIAEDNPATDPYECFLCEFFMGVTFTRNFKLFGGLKGMSGTYELPTVDATKVQRTGLPSDMMPRGMLGSFVKHELKLQEIFQSNKNMAVGAKQIDLYMASVRMSVSNSFVLAMTPVWGQAGIAWERHKLSRLMLLKCIDLIEHKKNGEFPGEIEDIPDTAAGSGTLNYRRTAGGFMIYSSGKNGKDARWAPESN